MGHGVGRGWDTKTFTDPADLGFGIRQPRDSRTAGLAARVPDLADHSQSFSASLRFCVSQSSRKCKSHAEAQSRFAWLLEGRAVRRVGRGDGAVVVVQRRDASGKIV